MFKGKIFLSILPLCTVENISDVTHTNEMGGAISAGFDFWKWVKLLVSLAVDSTIGCMASGDGSLE